MFDEEQVTEDEARQFAQSINAVFRMTSALKSQGIEDLFDCIGRKFIDPSYDEENPNNILLGYEYIAIKDNKVII